MPAVRRTPFIETLWKVHRWLYLRTSGRVGGRLIGNPLPVLLLTVTGRKSKTRRSTALNYLRDRERYAVIASNAGEPRHPEWYLNVRADPRVEIQVGRRRLKVTAREVEGAERDRLWSRVVAADPSYAEYQRRTKRRIPLVVLQEEPFS